MGINSVKAFSEVVGSIYQASYQPENWEVALGKIAALTGSRSAALFIQDKERGEVSGSYAYGIPKLVLKIYNTVFGKMDPAFKIMANAEVGVSQNIYTHEDHGVKRLYARVVNEPAGIFAVGGVSLMNDSRWHVGLGLHRGKHAGLYNDEELGLIDELVPHLQRALEIYREFTRLRSNMDVLHGLLDDMAVGIVLLDAEGEVLYKNPLAQSLLQYHPAILESKTGARAHEPVENRQLQERLTCDVEALNAFEPIGLSHPDARHPLVALVRPCTVDEKIPAGDVDANRVLYLIDSEMGVSLSQEQLMLLYGLTAAEARVAVALVNGLEIEAIAEQHNVTTHTVRSQIKSTYKKLGVSRQAELVRLLLSSTLPLR